MLVASGGSRDGALTVHQNVDVYAGRVAEGETVTHGLRPQRLGWVQVGRGTITLNGLTLSAGDGAMRRMAARDHGKRSSASSVSRCAKRVPNAASSCMKYT